LNKTGGKNTDANWGNELMPLAGVFASWQFDTENWCCCFKPPRSAHVEVFEFLSFWGSITAWDTDD